VTQADGILPEAVELRAVLGRARIVFKAYEEALAKSAAVMSTPGARTTHRHAALSLLSAAHADMTESLEATFTSLGLPYEAVIDVLG